MKPSAAGRYGSLFDLNSDFPRNYHDRMDVQLPIPSPVEMKNERSREGLSVRKDGV